MLRSQSLDRGNIVVAAYDLCLALKCMFHFFYTNEMETLDRLFLLILGLGLAGV